MIIARLVIRLGLIILLKLIVHEPLLPQRLVQIRMVSAVENVAARADTLLMHGGRPVARDKATAHDVRLRELLRELEILELHHAITEVRILNLQGFDGLLEVFDHALPDYAGLVLVVELLPGQFESTAEFDVLLLLSLLVGLEAVDLGLVLLDTVLQ